MSAPLEVGAATVTWMSSWMVTLSLHPPDEGKPSLDQEIDIWGFLTGKIRYTLAAAESYEVASITAVHVPCLRRLARDWGISTIAAIPQTVAKGPLLSGHVTVDLEYKCGRAVVPDGGSVSVG